MSDRYDEMAREWICQTEDKLHGCACVACRQSLAALLRRVAAEERKRNDPEGMNDA